jgi:hypothetical protein
MPGRSVGFVFGDRLTADLHFTTAGDHNLHLMAAARPGVGADLTAQETLLPAHGRCFGAAAWYADTYRRIAAAAGRGHAQRGLDWWRRAAAGTTSLGIACHYRAGGQHDRQNNTSQHFSFSPLWKNTIGPP